MKFCISFSPVLSTSLGSSLMWGNGEGTASAWENEGEWPYQGLLSLTLLKDAEAIAKAHIWYFRAVETVLNRLQHKSKWQWQNQKWPSWSLHEELCFTVSWNNRDVTCTDAYYMFSATISPTPDTVMQLFLPLNLSLLDSNN